MESPQQGRGLVSGMGFNSREEAAAQPGTGAMGAYFWVSPAQQPSPTAAWTTR